jgi:hypothetical protein
MGREDQIEEREVLDSIFPDEITGEVTQLRNPLAFQLTIFARRCFRCRIQNIYSFRYPGRGR